MTHIKTTGSNIRADQNAMFRVAELEKGVGPLLLLLLAVEIQHGAVNVVEELRVVLDRGTAAEENNDLLLLGLHASQKGKEQDKSLVGVAENVALLQSVHCTELFLLVDIDVEWARSQRNSRKILCSDSLLANGLGSSTASTEQFKCSASYVPTLVVCVAENSIVWRSSLDKTLTICRISSSKPTSKIRSASSITNDLRFLNTNGVFNK